jgi:hypothetical protein
MIIKANDENERINYEFYYGTVPGIVSELRNMKAAVKLFLEENLDTLDTNTQDTNTPEFKLLAPYFENPKRYTKKPGEYLFQKVDGKWWVGRNLALSEKFSEDLMSTSKKLNTMAGKVLYGSTDINIPYNGEDVIFMLVQP